MTARRWLSWSLLALVLAAALAVGVPDDGGPRSNADRAADIAASVRCPTCRGQSVLDSDAPAAGNIRAEIGRQVDDGRSDEEIRAYLVSTYGESILLNPPRSGVAALVWVLPVAALVAALAALAAAFRRWQAEPVSRATDEDEALVARARGRR